MEKKNVDSIVRPHSFVSYTALIESMEAVTAIKKDKKLYCGSCGKQLKKMECDSCQTINKAPSLISAPHQERMGITKK